MEVAPYSHDSGHERVVVGVAVEVELNVGGAVESDQTYPGLVPADVERSCDVRHCEENAILPDVRRDVRLLQRNDNVGVFTARLDRT